MSNVHLIQRQKLFHQSQDQSNTKNRNQLPFNVYLYPYRSLVEYEKRGHWSEKQRLKYVIFIQHFKERFQIQAKRRFSNVFQLMARFIKTRNSYQCRSHHQKMQKEKFKIDAIIYNISFKYHPRVYEQLKQKYTPQIISLSKNFPQDFELFKQKTDAVQLKTKQKQEYVPTERVLRSRKKKVKKNQNQEEIDQNLYQKNQNYEQYQRDEQIFQNRVKIQNQEEMGYIYQHPQHSYYANMRNQQRNMHIQNQAFKHNSYDRQRYIRDLNRKSEIYKQNGRYHFFQFNNWVAKSQQCYAAISHLLQVQRRRTQMHNQRVEKYKD